MSSRTRNVGARAIRSLGLPKVGHRKSTAGKKAKAEVRPPSREQPLLVLLPLAAPAAAAAPAKGGAKAGK